MCQIPAPTCPTGLGVGGEHVSEMGCEAVKWGMQVAPLLGQKLGGSVSTLRQNTRKPQKSKNQLRKSHALGMSGRSQQPK